MAKELWAHCEECDADFKVVADKDREIKVRQIIAGESGGVLGLTCPQGHRLMVDSSDKSKVFVRDK